MAPLYEALASEVRLQIIRLVAETPMNVKDLAASLGLSSAIVTMHVRKLQDVGIIQSKMIRKDGGTHKMNSLAVDWIGISMPQESGTARKLHEVSVPVGHYTHFDVYPTCGLATSNHVIGQYDDPRYFLDPERMHAHILWFGRGFVEYKIPNYILSGQQINAIELSLEIGSEAPSVNPNWPSDITFMLNGIRLGNGQALEIQATDVACSPRNGGVTVSISTACSRYCELPMRVRLLMDNIYPTLHSQISRSNATNGLFVFRWRKMLSM